MTPAPAPAARLERLLSTIGPLSGPAVREAVARQAQLTKPPGALGALEGASVTLCGIQRTCPPRRLSRPVVAVFAGDHG
ncbi:MAG TPA: nicotinate-nucleotide--dimethylbenzimidazole phosphoribosyltransferase, partial [Nocardioidaceae bacterium]|nr:nicotinate-nucleotide--dimethylbenzimidazole phosphoribosyltransferase [Nocardioidaceae bacterium]